MARPTARCGSSPTAPTGGTSTAGSPATTSRPWSAPTPTSACPRGCSARPATRCSTTAGWSCARWRDGFDGLAVRGPDGVLTDLDLPFTAVGSVRRGRPGRRRRGGRQPHRGARGAPHRPVRRDDHGSTPCARRATWGSRRRDLATGGRAVPVRRRRGRSRTGRALFYPPVNPDFRRPAGERPPLIVVIHGGPTAHGDAACWPSACSTGPAAASRWSTSTTAARRATAARTASCCTAQWGVVDVDDCVAAARALAERGRGRSGARLASAAGRRAATRRWPRWPVPTRRSRPAPTTSASPTSRRSPATRTSSSAATSTDSSGPTRRRARCTSSAHRSRTSSGSPAR